MKYKVTLNDSVELLILADSDVEAVRKAKSIKDALSNAKVNDLISMPWGDMDDLKRYAFHYGYKWIDVITGYENRTKGRGLTHEAAVEDLKNLMAAGKRLTDSVVAGEEEVEDSKNDDLISRLEESQRRVETRISNAYHIVKRALSKGDPKQLEFVKNEGRSIGEAIDNSFEYCHRMIVSRNGK